MDIKPFNQPVPDYWASLEIISAVILGIAVLTLLGAVFGLIVELPAFVTMCAVMIAFSFALIGLGSGLGDQNRKHVENYDNAIAELNDRLADDGFSLVSGTPDLKPNTQSSMLLSYEEKSFDCTMFSPKDVNKNIIFSCGEAKLTLNQIKETK